MRETSGKSVWTSARIKEQLYTESALPASQPVVHEDWKLNPPVIPSIFKTSPAKNKSLTSRLCIVLKSTSVNLTPPQVTNSSLNCPLPSIMNSAAISSSASLRNSTLERSAQFLSPIKSTNCFHKRNGIWENAGFVVTFLRAFSFHSLL